MNPALRLCAPKGLTAVGLKNLFGEPVYGDLVETANPPSASDMAHPGLRMVYKTGRASLPKGNASGRVYL